MNTQKPTPVPEAEVQNEKTGQKPDFCTKPFDPENSRYLDEDEPCQDGES